MAKLRFWAKVTKWWLRNRTHRQSWLVWPYNIGKLEYKSWILTNFGKEKFGGYWPMLSLSNYWWSSVTSTGKAERQHKHGQESDSIIRLHQSTPQQCCSPSQGVLQTLRCQSPFIQENNGATFWDHSRCQNNLINYEPHTKPCIPQFSSVWPGSPKQIVENMVQVRFLSP